MAGQGQNKLGRNSFFKMGKGLIKMKNEDTLICSSLIIYYMICNKFCLSDKERMLWHLVRAGEHRHYIETFSLIKHMTDVNWVDLYQVSFCCRSYAEWGWKTLRWLAHMKHGLSLTFGGGDPPCRVTSISPVRHIARGVCAKTPHSIPSNLLEFVPTLILCFSVTLICWKEWRWKGVLYKEVGRASKGDL